MRVCEPRVALASHTCATSFINSRRENDDIPFDIRTTDRRAEIKQSFEIANHVCPIIYSVVVNDAPNAEKDKETLKVRDVELDLADGRLLVIEMIGAEVVVRQGAIPPIDVTKNGILLSLDRVEEVEQIAARIVREVSQSLQEGTLKTRTVRTAP
jgi:hypothetical protein